MPKSIGETSGMNSSKFCQEPRHVSKKLTPCQ